MTSKYREDKNITQTGHEGVDWIPLAQELPRDVMCEHNNEISGATKGG